MISEAHKNKLLLHYGINPDRPEIRAQEESGQLKSITSQEIEALSGWRVDGPGLFIGYPGNGAFVIRPDSPLSDGPKYLHPKGEPNSVYIPSGFDLAGAQDLWITEGELKALCGSLHGLPVVALGGVWCWRTEGEEVSLLANGEKLKDPEALLPELAQATWEGKKVCLLYDSDITPGHKAYDAFPRLAEQLYRLGAEEVRVLSLPSVVQGQKTGLDDFILARGPEQALQDLRTIKDRSEPYLPWRDGGQAYAERKIKSSSPEDRLKAATAILGAKGRYTAGAWLKEHGLLQKDITPLLQDAKGKLAQLQSQAKPRSSGSPGQVGEAPQLGPEYAPVIALLKPHLAEYALDEQGRIGKIEWKTSYKDGGEVLEPVLKHICNFALWPIREILKDSGSGSPDRYLELQGLLQGGSPLRPAKIALPDFLEKNSWAGQLWGAKAGIKPNREKDLRYIVQLMARDIPTTTIYAHLGWRKIKDSWVYLHAKGAVGSEEVEVEASDRLNRYILPAETGDLKEALNVSLSLLELGPKKIMYPLFSLVWLCPLLELLRQAGIEPGFVTYLWGTSGSFKSTLIALMLSHFGNFGPKTLPASFRDTPKSIEEMAFQAKDILLNVDDLYPAKDLRERAKLEGVLEYLTRNQGDRQGRGRLKLGGNQGIALMSGHPPRGLTLCSGEIMPLSGSSLARNLVLHLLKEDINQGKLTQAQARKAFLPHSMRGYLEYLSPQLDALSSQFKKDFENLREQAKKDSKIRARHRRLDETVAFLFLGLNTFINYAVVQEAIAQEKAVKLLQDAWRVLNQVADELAQVAEREEPTKRFFEALLELQTTGRAYFATMEDVTPDLAERTLGAVKIGWGPDEKGVYYLLYGPAWEQVTKYLRAQEEGLPLSKTALLDSIEQQSLLDRSQGDRRVIKKKIAGEQHRVLPLLEKAFNLEVGENEA